MNTRGARSLPILSAPEQDRTQARCRRCGYVIVSPLSLETGYGKKCRLKLDGDDLEGERDE